MDANSIPFAYTLFPGNESEKISMRPLLKDVKSQFNLGRVIVVADRGLNTADNIYYLSGKNDSTCKNMDGYVYGQSVRGASQKFKDWVLEQNGYITDIIKKDNNPNNNIVFKHKSRVIAVEKKVNIETVSEKKSRKESKSGEKPETEKITIYQKQMVYFSQKYANKQKRDRQMMIEKAKDLIKNPSKYNKSTSYGAAGYVNNISFVKETGEIANVKNLSLDQAKIEEE